MGDISGVDMTALKCTSIDLSTGWAFKQTDNSDPNAWLPVKKVPSTVHQDLIDNKKYQSLTPKLRSANDFLDSRIPLSVSTRSKRNGWAQSHGSTEQNSRSQKGHQAQKPCSSSKVSIPLLMFASMERPFCTVTTCSCPSESI
jgi:hypothetical protein